jgi:hypothetical protein
MVPRWPVLDEFAQESNDNGDSFPAPELSPFHSVLEKQRPE